MSNNGGISICKTLNYLMISHPLRDEFHDAYNETAIIENEDQNLVEIVTEELRIFRLKMFLTI